MAIVLDLVTGALRRAGIIAESEDPSAEEGQDAVTRLNEIMASMQADGIDFGWNPKATTADTYVLPLEHVGPVKAILAVQLADEYGTEVSSSTGMEASDGYKRMLRQALQGQLQPVRLSSPRGDAQFYTSRILTGD